jgi:hypothetical protein
VVAVVPQVVIENPVINTPFEEPKRHFRFDDRLSVSRDRHASP